MMPALEACDRLEPAERFVLHASDGSVYLDLPRWRIREGARPEEIELGEFGYVDVARESFAVFSRLKQDGVIPQDARYQLSLPTPIAFIAVFLAPGSQAAYEPVHEAKMLEEVAGILEALPHDELAIQWDLAPETTILEGMLPHWFSGDPLTTIANATGRLLDAIPDGVEAGIHLCYGSATGENLFSPKDTGILAGLAGAIRAAAGRSVDWLHVPVPVSRDDAAYFESLAALGLDGTDLYLGLLHHEDGVEGAHRRIAAAREAGIEVSGVAAECGVGRLTEENIATLFELHREIGSELRSVS